MKPELDSDNKPELEKPPESQQEDKGGAPPSKRESNTLDSIADDLSGSMPDVQLHAIEQEVLNENEKLAQYSHLTDVDGNAFDPTVHKTNKAGEPTTSTKGKLIKKAGRKPNSATKPQKSYVGGSGQTSNPQAEKQMQARAAGTVSANMLMSLGMAFGGEEWQPRVNEQISLNEKTMLENAFADYFEVTGKTDLPPSMALAVAVGAYALPRFTMPKTQSRIQKLAGGVKKWYINRKLKKHGFRAESKEKPHQSPPPQSASLQA